MLLVFIDCCCCEGTSGCGGAIESDGAIGCGCCCFVKVEVELQIAIDIGVEPVGTKLVAAADAGIVAFVDGCCGTWGEVAVLIEFIIMIPSPKL